MMRCTEIACSFSSEKKSPGQWTTTFASRGTRTWMLECLARVSPTALRRVDASPESRGAGPRFRSAGVYRRAEAPLPAERAARRKERGGRLLCAELDAHLSQANAGVQRRTGEVRRLRCPGRWH